MSVCGLLLYTWKFHYSRQWKFERVRENREWFSSRLLVWVSVGSYSYDCIGWQTENLRHALWIYYNKCYTSNGIPNVCAFGKKKNHMPVKKNFLHSWKSVLMFHAHVKIHRNYAIRIRDKEKFDLSPFRVIMKRIKFKNRR